MPASKDGGAKEEGIKLVGRAKATMHNVHDMDYNNIVLPEHNGI